MLLTPVFFEAFVQDLFLRTDGEGTFMRAAKERTAPAIIRLMEYRYLAPNPSHSLKPRLRSIAVHSR
jgi:hypothetical protein